VVGKSSSVVPTEQTLSSIELQALGTAKSLYRTKADLTVLCKHNKIAVKSNFSKSDIVTALQRKETVLHTPECDQSVASTTVDSLKESVAKTSYSADSSIAPAIAPSREQSALADRDQHNVRFDLLKTLVVDDSAMNRKMLQRMLKLFNVNSDTAEDGKQAVDAVTRLGVNHYDIIFMDYTMPVMVSRKLLLIFLVCFLIPISPQDGVEATRIIRNTLKSTSKIVAVTGNAMESDVKAFGEVHLYSIMNRTNIVRSMCLFMFFLMYSRRSIHELFRPAPIV